MFDQAKKYFFQPLPENFESFPCLSWQEEKSSPDLRYPIALCTAGREKVDEQSQQIVVLKISGSATKISPQTTDIVKFSLDMGISTGHLSYFIL